MDVIYFCTARSVLFLCQKLTLYKLFMIIMATIRTIITMTIHDCARMPKFTTKKEKKKRPINMNNYS